MTDRIHSVTIILAKDIRIDDADPLITACGAFKGVIDVKPNVSDMTTEAVAEARVRHDLAKKLFDVVYGKASQ